MIEFLQFFCELIKVYGRKIGKYGTINYYK